MTAGLLKGKTLDLHCIDKKGDDTLTLLPISDLRRHRMVVDYEANSVLFKDRPDAWHRLPTSKKGLLLLPLTEEAVERFKEDQINAAYDSPDPPK